MKSHSKFLIAVLVTCLLASVSLAMEKPGSRQQTLQKGTAGLPYVIMNANNVTMWAHSDGFFNWLISQSWNGEFPRLSGVGTIFSEGIVFGGLVNDGLYTQTLRVTGDTYFIGMQPGAIKTDPVSGKVTGPDNASDPGVRAFAVRPNMPPSVDGLPAKWPDLTVDAATYFQKSQASVSDGDKAQIASSYIKDWKEWPAKKGAPWFIDSIGVVRNDAGFDPANPHHIPGIPGATKTIWYVCNDLSAAVAGTFAGSPPMGMEEQMTIWAYASSTPLNDIIFKQVKLIYKGNPNAPATSRIDSMYVVQWSDPDNGDAGDDYAGCDSLMSLGYDWNSKTVDAKYAAVGLPSAATGYVYLQGAAKYTGIASDSAVVNFQWRHGYKYFWDRPLTAFDYFAAGSPISDPDDGVYAGTQQWYNLMRGCLPRPAYPAATPFYKSSGYATAHNIVTSYTLPGDPPSGQGWIDGYDIQAGDRRLVNVHGPITMKLSDTAEVVIALVDGMGADNLSSVKVLKYNSTYAQFAFNNLFKLPAPPPSPTPDVSNLDGEVVLNWGDNPTNVKSIEASNNSGFAFEGYNVYQLPSPSASLSDGVRIATYDLVDNVTVIVAPALDLSSGVIVTKPVAFGSDNGLSRDISLKTDYLAQRPLVNGQVYYYAVTAYSYNPFWNVAGNVFAAPFPSLESAPVIKAATPTSNVPGHRFIFAVGDSIPVTHYSASGTLSDGGVVSRVVQPDKLTGDKYKVIFDTTGGSTSWKLIDSTKNNTVLFTGTNQKGNNDYLIIDGLQVIVAGPPPGMKGWSWTPSASRFWTWSNANWGAEGFNGAIGNAFDQWFSSSTVTYDKLKNVEIRFATTDASGNILDPNDANASYAYRYLRSATAAPAQPSFAPFIINKTGGYAFQDYNKSMPLAAYDMEANPPRRLMVGYLENNRVNGLVDGKYWPPFAGDATYGDNIGSSGPREWFYIFNTTYSTTPDPALEKDILNNTLPIMWFGTVTRRNQNAWTSASTFEIYANHINTVNDVFSFVATAPTYSNATAASDVDKINVFPNPYYGFNTRETNRLNKYVRFTHLPPNATIRIFNLAGVLVNTLRSDATSATPTFVDWHLINQRSLPVASGIYIAYIDMPDLGKTKILKIAVVQEEQILPTY